MIELTALQEKIATFSLLCQVKFDEPMSVIPLSALAVEQK